MLVDSNDPGRDKRHRTAGRGTRSPRAGVRRPARLYAPGPWREPHGRRPRRSSPTPRRQLPLLPPALRRPDAQAAASRGARRLRDGHEAQPQQPRPRRRPRQLRAWRSKRSREIAAMFGWAEFLGHLTSGGTFANLEALWVAGQMAPGKKIVASEQAHYTHSRISAVLGLPFGSVATDHHGRMDLAALESSLAAGDVGTVVATLGTTAVGAVDPLDQILRLAEQIPLPRTRRRSLRRLFPPRLEPRPRCAARLRPHRRGRLHRGRSPQARPAALWLRMRPLSRSRRWAAGTSTTRPTPTSPPASCISARSAWNARAPALQP